MQPFGEKPFCDCQGWRAQRRSNPFDFLLIRHRRYAKVVNKKTRTVFVFDSIFFPPKRLFYTPCLCAVQFIVYCAACDQSKLMLFAVFPSRRSSLRQLEPITVKFHKKTTSSADIERRWVRQGRSGKQEKTRGAILRTRRFILQFVGPHVSEMAASRIHIENL